MADALHIVCPHCDSINRAPRQRLFVNDARSSAKLMKVLAATPSPQKVARMIAASYVGGGD